MFESYEIYVNENENKNAVLPIISAQYMYMVSAVDLLWGFSGYVYYSGSGWKWLI